MKIKKNNATEQRVYAIAEPIAAEHDVTIWDVCFEKEGAAWYLRVFIDKPDGISIDDCEAVSRPLSDQLDIDDPIPQQYFLEVGSAGLERELVRESHFSASVSTLVRVHLIRPDEAGEKEYIAVLTAFDKDAVTLETADGVAMQLPLANVAHIKRYEEFD